MVMQPRADAWLQALDQVHDKPWLLALAQRHGSRIYRRFQQQYRRLLSQPARSTQRLQRRLGLGLAGAALLLALAGVGLSPRQAFADSITVDGATCTLADAITAANTDTATGGCTTGSGADTLNLTADIGLMAELPWISSEITIEGSGHTISRTSGSFRILTVAAGGNLTLNSATITGGTAVFGGGIYAISGTLALTNSTISGNSGVTGGGIYAKSASLSVSNSTLSGNSAIGNGGGIWANSASVAVTNSTLSGNSAHLGGGFWASSASVAVTYSTLSGNSARAGGGGIFAVSATVMVTNSTLSGNQGTIYCCSIHAPSSIGGGIVAEWSTMAVTNSTLSGNSANLGGSIYAFRSYLAVTNSTLSGNSARLGGGIWSNTAEVAVTNSTLSGNSASNLGGGIDARSDSTVTVTNSTLSGNSTDRGGGLSAWSSTVALARSLISGNSATTAGNEVYSVGGTFTSINHNLFGHNGETEAQAFSGGLTPTATDIVATSDATPPGNHLPTAQGAILSTTLADNGSSVEAGTHPGSVVQTLLLVSGSPAIDASPDAGCPATDQRGSARLQDVGVAGPAGSTCDIGAFERKPSDDGPPGAEGAGPYSGLEGSPIALDGSSSTDDHGITHYLWDCTNDGVFDSGAAAVANCTYPDNGAYTALLQVIDTVGQTDEDTAAVTVGNVPPTATWVAPGSVNEGSAILIKLINPYDPSPVDVAAGFKHAFDCGTGTFTAFDCGTGTFTAFAAANSRSCPTTDSGVRNVRGKIQDKDLGTTAYAKPVTVNNVPPSATFSAPASVNEGSAFQLALLNRTDPSSVDTTAGFKQGFDCGDGVGFNAWGAGTTRSCAAPADGPAARTVKGRVRDKDLGANSYSKGLTVKNVAPSAKFLIAVVKGTNKFTLKLTTPTDPSAPDRAAGFTYSNDCGNGAGFNAFSGSTNRTCVGVVGTTYAVKGRIRDKDGGIRTYSANLRFTLSPSGQIEPLIDARSMVEVESQEE